MTALNNSPWGGRFTKVLDSRVLKFTTSLIFDHILLEYDIAGSKVHAMMLGKQHLISEKEADLICKALEEILVEIKDKKYTVDCEFEDIHMLVESLLIAKIGQVGKKLHTGRSRNDQVALDLRLYTRDASVKIENLLLILLSTLNSLSKKHIEDKMPGYTHLQQAQIISLGEYFIAYANMFERDISRIKDWRKRMNFSPLGAGAIAGTSLPIDRDFVANNLGFDGIVKNTIDAVSDRDYIIELHSILAIIMVHLSRLAEDFIIWATQEFSLISIDDAFATGSSLMPNKKNPDVLELIRGKSGRIFGHLMAILTVMKGLPLSYNRDMQEDKEGLFDSIHTTISCLELISPLLENIYFNTNLMKERAESGYLDATLILEKLVLEGVPFREAHHIVGNMVKSAIESKCSLSEIMRNKKSL